MTSPTLLRPTLAALLCGLATSCGSAETDILLTLSNLPSRATSVAVTAKLNSQILKTSTSQTALTDLPQNQLGIKLPATGHIDLDIQALDSDLCTQGEAQTSIDVPSGLSNLNAPLTATMPRRCGNLPACASGTSCIISPSVTTNDIQAFWALAPNNIWAVGNALTVLHYDGNSWTATPSASLPIPASTILYGVWASSASDVWAVGQVGRIIHYDGSKWTQSSNGAVNSFLGISGLSAQNIYAVGAASTTTSPGEFWHYDGAVWSQIQPVVKGNLGAVWAVSPTMIVTGGGPAAGTGTLVTWDGTKITDYSSSVSLTKLHGIWGSDNTHVFAVGDLGSIYRFDGSTWKLISTPYSNNLFGVTGDGTSVYVVGTGGLIAHNTDSTFSSFPASASATGSSLYTVQIQPGGNGIVWLGGVGGFLGYLDSRP